MGGWGIVIRGLVFFIASLAFGKTYPVDGVVVAVDPVARTLLVSHRPIAGYMGAMTMPFRAGDAGELRGLHAGMRITFELVVGGKSSVARRIRATGLPDEAVRPPKERLAIGAAVPGAALIDETGKQVRLTDFLGKVVAVDFIYTRCPLPDVCPRLSANFAAIQKRFAGRDVVLVSITVDADYDTPEVLAEYARRWGARAGVWKFLTGDAGKVAALLGEVYWTDEGSIGHNSSTVVVGRDGRLAAILEGSGWRVDQLAGLLRHELEK